MTLVSPSRPVTWSLSVLIVTLSVRPEAVSILRAKVCKVSLASIVTATDRPLVDDVT
ncbi:hypothetical protein D3C86_2222180 [compost metagenome]